MTNDLIKNNRVSHKLKTVLRTLVEEFPGCFNIFYLQIVVEI